MTIHAFFIFAAIIFAAYALLAIAATIHSHHRNHQRKLIESAQLRATAPSPYNDVDDIFIPSSL